MATLPLSFNLKRSMVP